MVIYTIQTITIQPQQKKKARHWNFKYLSVVHNIYKWFFLIVVSDLRSNAAHE